MVAGLGGPRWHVGLARNAYARNDMRCSLLFKQPIGPPNTGPT